MQFPEPEGMTACQALGIPRATSRLGQPACGPSNMRAAAAAAAAAVEVHQPPADAA
jgi:hypothetical protein